MHERAARDWYVEPDWAIDLLLDHERFDGVNVDPCAGQATIPLAFCRRGAICLGSDLLPQHPMVGAVDFMAWPVNRFVDNIIFNPPYDRAEEFILQACRHTRGKVAALVQEKFPYSEGRHLFFEQRARPAKIYFFSSRPSMPPGEMLRDGSLTASGGKVNYIWMIWDRNRIGPPTCHWLIKPAALDREIRRAANR